MLAIFPKEKLLRRFRNGKGKDALQNLGLGNWFFRFQALLPFLFELFVCQMDPPDRFPMESSPLLSFLLPPLGQIFSPRLLLRLFFSSSIEWTP